MIRKNFGERGCVNETAKVFQLNIFTYGIVTTFYLETQSRKTDFH